MIPPLVLVTAVLALIVAVSLGGYKLYDYTENNPKFCASCHIMDPAYSKWSVSAHKGVNCHDCHQLGYLERANLVVSFLVQRSQSVPPRHGKIIVPYTICIQCHLQGPVAEARPIRGTAGHRKHFFDKGVECTHCHGTRLHEFLPEAGFCTRCHQDIKVHAKVMSGFDCLTCHDFLSRTAASMIPDRKVCLNCHQDMNPNVSFPTGRDAAMQFNCNRCHDPHEKIKSTPDPCLQCHDQIRRFGLHKGEYHQECSTCHKPHIWKVTSRDVCLTCHEDRRNHKQRMRCDQCHEFRDLRIAHLDDF
jgi:hypothetical protein